VGGKRRGGTLLWDGENPGLRPEGRCPQMGAKKGIYYKWKVGSNDPG